MSSPSESITDIGKRDKERVYLCNQLTPNFIDESGLNRKRERAQSVEPNQPQDLEEQVRIPHTKKVEYLYYFIDQGNV